MRLDDYDQDCSCAELTRTAEGVLTIRLHTNGGEFEWSQESLEQLPNLFTAVASDLANRVVVLTGTGQHCLASPHSTPFPIVKGKQAASFWQQLAATALRLTNALLEIPVPVISAVNGGVDVHAEVLLFSDIVLCTPGTYFTDKSHFSSGYLPGDGAIWLRLLGPNRGRYFLITGQRLDAEQARELGVVQEVVPDEELRSRALALAADIAVKNPVMVRNARALLVYPLKRAILDEVHYGLTLSAVSGAEFDDGAEGSADLTGSI